MRLILTSLLLAASAAAPAATVVVDTGHSRMQTGSKAADGTTEFSYNRAMAQAVIFELKQRRHNVIDVQDEGDDTTLTKRVNKTLGADLFLSIHHDSIQQEYLDAGRERQFTGHAIFASALSKHLKPSLKCAMTIGDAMLQSGSKPSRYHAAPVKGENRPLIDAKRGIHRYDHLVVLKVAQSPAVLLEVGVIVNPDELPRLKDPTWVKSTASNIADGIEACVRR